MSTVAAPAASPNTRLPPPTRHASEMVAALRHVQQREHDRRDDDGDGCRGDAPARARTVAGTALDRAEHEAAEEQRFDERPEPHDEKHSYDGRS